ncbi:hypothetical protein NY588_09685 [Curtobacterium flaccumfaciens pv. beticola]|uniref:hypothetical protein n=1 Tax=Curtobacterium flaccumfaciens TaxID=2035 RepID=UPI00349FA2ED|nr:hypothetical protein [Curtobacterium flaccumfaciens pv. basellae]
MSFQPTPEERRKYSDYDVEIRDAQNNHVRIAVEDGEVIRFYARAHRIPSLKKFIVFVYLGATEQDRRRAERWAADLPAGGWAQFPLCWFKRRRPDGSYLWKQETGVVAPDPFAQLELEMMIDAGSEVHA